MASEVRDITNAVISYKVLEVRPKENPILIKNRLLNGKSQFQTIGDSEEQVEAVFLISAQNKTTLDAHYKDAIPITIETNVNLYYGIIEQEPTYQLEIIGNESERLYRCSVLISQE